LAIFPAATRVRYAHTRGDRRNGDLVRLAVDDHRVRAIRALFSRWAHCGARVV